MAPVATGYLSFVTRRWAPLQTLVVKDPVVTVIDGPLGARVLRNSCDEMSSSVLYERLREHLAAGLIQQSEGQEYELTKIGRALGEAIEPLGAWAERWSKSRRPRRRIG